MRHRRIREPQRDGLTFTLKNTTTKEIWQCSDLAPLLRIMVVEIEQSYWGPWTFSWEYQR